jgi:hypothetical protein
MLSLPSSGEILYESNPDLEAGTAILDMIKFVLRKD